LNGLDRILLVVFACLGLSWVGIAAYLLVSRLLFDLRLGSLRTGRVLVPAKVAAPARQPLAQPAPLPAPAVVPALATAGSLAASSVSVARQPRRTPHLRRSRTPVGAAGTRVLK
jgi:hypothetical protein